MTQCYTELGFHDETKQSTKSKCIYFAILAHVYFEQGDTERLALVVKAWQPYASKHAKQKGHDMLPFYRAYLNGEDARCLALCNAWKRHADRNAYTRYRATLFSALIYAHKGDVELARTCAAQAAAMAPGMPAAVALDRAFRESGDTVDARALAESGPTLPDSILRSEDKAAQRKGRFGTFLLSACLILLAYACTYLPCFSQL